MLVTKQFKHKPDFTFIVILFYSPIECCRTDKIHCTTYPSNSIFCVCRWCQSQLLSVFLHFRCRGTYFFFSCLFLLYYIHSINISLTSWIIYFLSFHNIFFLLLISFTFLSRYVLAPEIQFLLFYSSFPRTLQTQMCQHIFSSRCLREKQKMLPILAFVIFCKILSITLLQLTLIKYLGVTSLIIGPTRCTNFSKFYFGINLYMFRTVPLSIIRSSSLYAQQWYVI